MEIWESHGTKRSVQLWKFGKVMGLKGLYSWKFGKVMGTEEFPSMAKSCGFDIFADSPTKNEMDLNKKKCLLCLCTVQEMIWVVRVCLHNAHAMPLKSDLACWFSAKKISSWKSILQSWKSHQMLKIKSSVDPASNIVLMLDTKCDPAMTEISFTS